MGKVELRGGTEPELAALAKRVSLTGGFVVFAVGNQSPLFLRRFGNELFDPLARLLALSSNLVQVARKWHKWIYQLRLLRLPTGARDLW